MRSARLAQAVCMSCFRRRQHARLCSDRFNREWRGNRRVSKPRPDFRALFLPLLLVLPIVASASDTRSAEALSIICFGSCNKSFLNQPLWEPILKNDPKLWIWLGDVIYGDDQMNPANLRAQFDQQKQQIGYAELRRRCPII